MCPYLLALLLAALLYRRLRLPLWGHVSVGDSLVAGLPGAKLCVPGGSTADLLPLLPKLKRAKSLHIQIGTNDLFYREDGIADRLRAIADALPKVPVTWSGIPPTRHFDVAEANAVIRALCAERGFKYVDTEALAQHHTRDGLHLTAEGYRVWLHGPTDAM